MDAATKTIIFLEFKFYSHDMKYLTYSNGMIEWDMML